MAMRIDAENTGTDPDDRSSSGDEITASADDASGFPETASTRPRAAAAWWFIFVGPLLIAVAALAAVALGGGERVAFLSIIVTVFIVTWIVGLLASAKTNRYWWITPIAVAFVASLAMVGLLSLADVAVPSETSTSSTTTTSSTTAAP
jgi:hypothetical protein